MTALSMSAQQLRDATQGRDPSLSAECLVHLALLAGIDATDALRAGGQEELADVLAEVFAKGKRRQPTIEERALLKGLDALSETARQHVEALISELARQGGRRDK